MIRFRTGPSLSKPRVDREKGMIFGASAIQAVEALGHRLLVDDVMLRQVAELGNAAVKVKSRFTHPGMCSDGMGKQVGHATNFRVEGDKALCDIQCLEAAAKSPSGDLRGYVLALADESPKDFGLSIVFSGIAVWKLTDGSEVPFNDASLRDDRDGQYWDWTTKAYYRRPDTATTAYPFARCADLGAVDVVDEPAANRDGLFSAQSFSANNQLAEEAFSQIDEFRSQHGITLATLESFFHRYRASRAPSPPESPMKLSARLLKLSESPIAAPIILKALGAEKPADEIEIVEQVFTAQATALLGQIDTLKAQLAKTQTDSAAALKAETDKNADLAKQLAAAQEKITKFKNFQEGSEKHVDPGGDGYAAASGDDQVDAKRHWSEDAKARAFFHNSEADFLAAVEHDGLATVKTEIAKVN